MKKNLKFLSKQNNDMLCENNNLIEINNNKSFLFKLWHKYENWKGIGPILIAIIVIISIFIIVNNSFFLNNTYELMNKDALKQLDEKILSILKQLLSDEAKNFKHHFYMLKTLFRIWCETRLIDKIFYNGILILATFMFSYMIIGKTKIALIASTGFWIFIDIANYIVFNIRGAVLTISDIFSLSTALTVVEGIKFKPEIDFFIFINFSIIYFIILSLIKFKEKDRSRKFLNISKRICALIITILCVNTVLNIDGFKKTEYWDLEKTYKTRGLEYSMLRQALDFKIEKPNGYSLEKVEEILSRYKETNKTDKNVNIIVIINETFADINKVYELGFKNNIPYYDSLHENAIKGTVYSSVFAGGTANAEWEFLTGNSSAYIPANSLPFILYINNNKETIVSNAIMQGYKSVAIHPYYQDGYNRAASYPKLGFDKSIFLEDMLDYQRNSTWYPSDEYTYNKLIEEYEKRDKNSKFFGYVLTMQNHSPYTTPNTFYNTDGYVENNDELDEYLSLIKDSDDALKKLLEYFSAEKEKTILLFFGDHQPNLKFEYNREKLDNKWLIAQQIPYLLWANFDIEEKSGKDTSFNLLSTLLYDYANLDTTRYIEFLKEFKEYFPVFTAKGYKDKDGNVYNINEENSPYQEFINEYKILQYYFMFEHNI